MLQIPQTSSSPRFPEIDLVRGLAVLGMILYHEVFIFVYLTQETLWRPSPLPRLFGTLVAFTFLGVFGLSAHIKNARLQEKKVSFGSIYLAFAQRGMELVLAAIAVTVVTYLVIPSFFIRFGILHFLAFSTFLLPFLLQSKRRLVIACATVVMLWLFLGTWLPMVHTIVLLPLNLMPPGYMALDHWPLVPYLIVPLLGALVGFRYYPGGKRSFSISTNLASQSARPILWLGRHALLVYLIHAPILIALTWLLIQP